MTTDPILAAVERVDRAVVELRQDLGGRLAELVTRREHEAEVRRIDSEHAALVQAHADLRVSADLEHSELREAISADRSERRTERQRVDDARRADRRTYLAVTVSAVGVAVAVAALIVSIIVRV